VYYRIFLDLEIGKSTIYTHNIFENNRNDDGRGQRSTNLPKRKNQTMSRPRTAPSLDRVLEAVVCQCEML